MVQKVLFLNTVAGKGSVGRIVTGLASALRDRGTDSLIAFGRWDAPENFSTYRIGSDADVYIHGALSRITDRHGLYSKGPTEKLISKIRQYDPEIIHIHNVHGYYVNFEILFSFLKNEFSSDPGHRIIWTLHDCWSFTGHCVHFEYAGCDKWKTGCFNCPEKDQYPRSFLMDSSRSNYGLKKECFTGIRNLTLVTPSEWLKSKVKESFLKEYPVETIPTGIDLNVFKPVKSDLRERYGISGKKVLLGVANPWRDRKGFRDFMELAGQTGDDKVIVMIGLSKKQAGIMSKYKNVIPLMKTDSVKEMAEWYSTSDIYVNLTREDTFPTTNIEAMACGTPVITYRAGGSPESLTDETGIVTAENNISCVMESIDRLLSRDREEARKVCVQRAEAYGSEKRFQSYIEKVYEKIL